MSIDLSEPYDSLIRVGYIDLSREVDSDQNSCVNSILEGETLTIRENRQMIVSDGISIIGDLEIIGDLTLI